MEKVKILPLADSHFQIFRKVEIPNLGLFQKFSASTARLLDSFSMSALDISMCPNTECWVNTPLYEAEKANCCRKLCTKYSKVQLILTNIKLVMAWEMMRNNPQVLKSCIPVFLIRVFLYSSIPDYRTHVLCSDQVRRNLLSFCCFLVLRKQNICEGDIQTWP